MQKVTVGDILLEWQINAFEKNTLHGGMKGFCLAYSCYPKI